MVITLHMCTSVSPRKCQAIIDSCFDHQHGLNLKTLQMRRAFLDKSIFPETFFLKALVFWLSKFHMKNNAQGGDKHCEPMLDLDLVHFTGLDLLPRGKGHNRTSRSLTRCPTSPTPIHIRKTATAPGSPLLFK